MPEVLTFRDREGVHMQGMCHIMFSSMQRGDKGRRLWKFWWSSIWSALAMSSLICFWYDNFQLKVCMMRRYIFRVYLGGLQASSGSKKIATSWVLCEGLFRADSWSWVEITHLCHTLHNLPIQFYFSRASRRLPPVTRPRALSFCPSRSVLVADASWSSVGRPDRRGTPEMSLPPLPRPLSSSCWVHLPHPPPLT
jgi:hypothetical protein